MQVHPLMVLCAGLAACGQAEPPLSDAGRAARAFLEAFSTGDHDAALRLSTGDVRHGVEVAKESRAHERQEHPAEVALLEKAMREHPPDVRVMAPRRHEDTAEVRAVVTTEGPRGPQTTRYELWLVWRAPRWLVYRWGPAGR